MGVEQKFQVLIVGGGTAGISVAAQLKRQQPTLHIGIIEPSDKHYYQPLWTLVGAGICKFSESERSERDQIPAGVTWIRDFAVSFVPANNTVVTKEHGAIQYDYLVVAPGMQIDWQKIEGVQETMGKNGVCSNYSQSTVERTWDTIREFRGGTAIFTFPNTPIKCAGAPQKIMYLAEHYFRKSGVRQQSEVMFVSAGAAIFGVKKYADALNKIIAERNIKTLFKHNLEKVDAQRKVAVFRNLETQELKEIPFAMLHVAPPMSAPDFIKQSPLANEAGWIDVHKHTMRHNKFPNIFGLGDASSLPTSRTGAAIRKQAPILVSHLLATMSNQKSNASYDGYASCPLVTGYGKLILAEFDYDGKPAETFPFDQAKERRSMYLLKRYILPVLYWQGMMKGRA